MTDNQEWGGLTPARKETTLPALEGFETFENTIWTLEEWDFTLSEEEIKAALHILGDVHVLLADIGLSPDRKYSVLEIERLQTAVLWALGGG